MNALHRIHAALKRGAVVIDSQPVSARPPVGTVGRQLGELDMRAWRALIEEIDALTLEVIDAGLFAVVQERDIVVTDTCETGAEFLDTVADWKGTRVPADLARKVARTAEPVSVRQTVRLRVLRAS